jgi:hypothetical protein
VRPLTLVTLRCPQRCFLGVIVATDEGPRVIMETRNEKVSALPPSDFPEARRLRVKGTRTFAIRLDELPSGLEFGCRHGGGTTAAADLRALVAEVRAGTTRAGVDHILQV